MESRYQRQLVIPKFGIDGQRRLAATKLLVVGAGGLGSAATLALVGAGCGCHVAQQLQGLQGWVRLVDYDKVTISNLNRQFLYTEDDLGKPKVDCAANRLRSLDASLAIETLAVAFNPANAARLLSGVDLVLDCTDNLETKQCLNHWCFHLGISLVSASISRHSGFIQCVDGVNPPCLACVNRFASGGSDCAVEGVVGAAVQAFGSLLAYQAIRYIVKGEFGMSGLWLFDCEYMQASNLKLVPDDKCRVCAQKQPPAMDSIEVDWNERLPNWLLVDIRESSAPIKGSKIRNIPAARLQSNLAQELPELFAADASKTLVLVCNRGVQSLALAHTLREEQPEINTKSLRGGIAQMQDTAS